LGQRFGAGVISASQRVRGSTFIRSHFVAIRADCSQHYLPKRGKADKAVLSFFAHEQESRVLCYANANLRRRDQAGETMRFVEFWYAITGSDPEGLSFDSKVTRYEELSQLNQRGVWFITIWRRGDPMPLASAACQQMATSCD
jgi:hypothetical protein